MSERDWDVELAELERGQRALAATSFIEAYVPRKYHGAVCEVPALQAWIDDPRGVGYVYGPVGVGKTYASWGAVNRYFHSTPLWGSYGRVFWGGSLHQLLDGMRPDAVEYDDMPLGQLAKVCGLLFIDDVGTVRLTEWGMGQLFAVIDYRYYNELPMLITTNVKPNELGEHLDERIVSRLAEDAQIIAMQGPDRRRL